MTSLPFVASPATVISAWPDSSSFRPARTMAWSSASSTRIIDLSLFQETRGRHDDLHHRSAFPPRHYSRLSTQSVRTFLDAEHAVRLAAPGGHRVESHSVVGDPDDQVVGRPANHDGDLRRPRMAGDIGQRFL